MLSPTDLPQTPQDGFQVRVTLLDQIVHGPFDRRGGLPWAHYQAALPGLRERRTRRRNRQPPRSLFADALGDSLLLAFVGAQPPAAAARLDVDQRCRAMSDNVFAGCDTGSNYSKLLP